MHSKPMNMHKKLAMGDNEHYGESSKTKSKKKSSGDCCDGMNKKGGKKNGRVSY